MPEDKKIYYGENEIINVEDAPNGMKRVEIKYPSPKKNEDGSEDTGEKFDVMEWELEAAAHTVPTTESDVRNYEAIYIVDKIYDLFKELNVKVDDIGYITQKLLAKLKGVEQQAILNCFGVEEGNTRISDWESKL